MDLDFILPNTVRVNFPRLCKGIPQKGFDSYTSSLTDFPEMTAIGARGFRGEKNFRDLTWSTSANGSAINSLYSRVARDYYHFACGRVDAKLAGVVPWQPEGLTDVVEFVYDVAEESTRLTREPWANDPDELQHQITGNEIDVTWPKWGTLHGLGPVYTYTFFDEYTGGGYDAVPGTPDTTNLDTSAVAMEINGVMGLDGAIAQLWPTDACMLKFTACCGGTVAGGSGSGGSGSGSGSGGSGSGSGGGPCVGSCSWVCSGGSSGAGTWVKVSSCVTKGCTCDPPDPSLFGCLHNPSGQTTTTPCHS